ncbi:hypothetical protein QBC44DRAFT_384389 [Cladorrhinum sp. PSN332]|nr:hypothetical protein QBC44DRAFT_384389 [Cladorrhinum sp. PSN332]
MATSRLLRRSKNTDRGFVSNLVENVVGAIQGNSNEPNEKIPEERKKIEEERERLDREDQARNPRQNGGADAKSQTKRPKESSSTTTEASSRPTTVMITTTAIATQPPSIPLQSISNQVGDALSIRTSTAGLPLSESTTSGVKAAETGSATERKSGNGNGGKGFGPVVKAGIAIGTVACLFVILACIVFIFRRFRSGGSRYGSSSSYISSNKSSSSRRRSRTSRDMEETLLEDDPNESNAYRNETPEKPKPAISRWMSEVYRHQLTDPARASVSLPSAGTRSQGQPADISDISSILTTAATHTTHSTNGNFKPRTALRHPNLPPIGPSLTQPFDPTFEGQSPVIQVSPATPSSSSTYSQSSNSRTDGRLPSIPLAVRLSGVGVNPSDPYLENSNYNRDSMGSNISSMSAKTKRRSI